jgi:hypothetical protein
MALREMALGEVERWVVPDMLRRRPTGGCTGIANAAGGT